MIRYKTVSDVQQVCLNGHQITGSYNNDETSRKSFCPICGEKTITKCPKCNSDIKGNEVTIDTGYDTIESVIAVSVPIFCDSCGKPFPWADKISTKTAPSGSTTIERSNNRKVFIVHGQDEKIKSEVEDFLISIGLDPIILHKQASLGKTIIEKVEHYSDVGFAVILLTEDDLGGAIPSGEATTEESYLYKFIENPKLLESISENERDILKSQFFKWFVEAFSLLKTRARQNVIFEFGYFIAKLGRDKVAALCEEGIERPSDIDGLLYTPIDQKGEWKKKLAKEIDASGIKIDEKYLI
jgi:predicted nucleotide-binding protein/predicted RNA-binding Zn-ribbon protein involved in translation (DUF1610 family)